MYHGPDRAKGYYNFSDFDIVFTTYPTLAHEWKAKGGRTRIFTHHWHRVVLDEGWHPRANFPQLDQILTFLVVAHWIKNSASVAFQATFALVADCRWVITATPIQNHPSELFSLFRFLRLYPYNEYRSLELVSENPEVAVEKLKQLLRFTMLRRLKDILHLPTRTDMVIPLDLNGKDRARYNLAKRATIKYLDDIINSETAGNGYVNAISKINALRMVCNLGCSDPPRDAVTPAYRSPGASMRDFDGPFCFRDNPLGDDEATGSPSTCTVCGTLSLDLPMHASEGRFSSRVTGARPSKLINSETLSQCRSCFADAIGTMGSSHEGSPKSQLDPHVLSSITLQGNRGSNTAYSTKIKALVSDLKTQRQASKRSVYICISTKLEL